MNWIRVRRPVIESEVFRIAKYGVVGVFATLIHVSAAYLYLFFLGTSVLFSNSFGFLFAFAASYTLQSKFVFARSLSFPKAARYFLVQFAALLVSVLVATLLVDANPYIKVLVVAFVLPLITFVIHRLWTFSEGN